MTYETLDFDVRGAVAWITLNRPDRFNAMNPAMMRELFDVANRCSSNREIRAAVLTGSGDQAFCAGGDVSEFADNLESFDLLVKEMTSYLHAAASRFAWMRAPLIGAVNGVAAGAGLGLVSFCDLVVTAETASFTSAYTQIGLTPDGSSTYFLSRILGHRRAMELFLTNRVLSAAEALDWGLVNKVVAAPDLRGETEALAARLAEGPTGAYGGVKKLLQTAATDGLESQMERESRWIAEMGMSADGREGIRAFMEKRKPQFSGG
ncbi:enoyl-CoA hydratase/isomerase family protein [Pelagibius sp.]|uniref:enoyl-CoA hydratase/isomerase family protein n=1 Tax=Pelagibius sp. TaxID=1931238 RepID=UPI002625FECD|nr:enoyl-CoA hydratase/isomerase family protein [Pelagibius sp.]